MNIDTVPPQSAVTSKPLIPLPAQFLHDLSQNKLQSKYQDHYSSDVYFPPADPLWPSSGRSSSARGLQHLNKTSYASQDWGTAAAAEIAQPQASSVAMPAYPTIYFFHPPSNPYAPPTVYSRMASPATRQRTIQACTNCRERKTKVRLFTLVQRFLHPR
jgi:hypothetical protein